MVIQLNKVSSPKEIHHLSVDNRDPLDVNKQIQANWTSVIGEPLEGLRSPEWAWKLSSEVFTFVQAATYRLLVILLAPLLSLIIAIHFGILYFLQIWCVRPILKFFHVIFGATRSFIELTLNGTIGPAFEVMGLVCSRAKVKHQRAYDVNDEPPYPYII